MTDETLELEFVSDPQIMSVLRERVRAWTGAHGWTEPQIGEIVLALDEAVTNVICHGYGGRCQQPILISGRVLDAPEHGGGIEIRIRDFGKQVDPARICGRDLNEVRPGGLGVHIIRAMMNSTEYRAAEGGGMLLTLRKYKTHRAEARP